MYKISERRGINTIERFINKDLAYVKFDEKRSEFHVYLYKDHHIAYMIEAYNEYEGEDEKTGFSPDDFESEIHIYSEDGFNAFFDVFITAKPINISGDREVRDKFKFLSAFLGSRNFNLDLNDVNDYKYYFQYDGDNYLFVTPRTPFESPEKNFLHFVYRYSVNFFHFRVTSYSSVEFFDCNFMKNKLIIDNNSSRVNYCINEIIASKCKDFDLSPKTLKLRDYILFQMINI